MDQDRWLKLSLAGQLANIGSEVQRTNVWQVKGETANMQHAADRALELIDLTLADSRWRHRLKEITRLREIFSDYFIGGNNYNSSGKALNEYLLNFAVIARK